MKLGLTTYFTGKPCRRGHVAARRTVNSSCITCERQDRVRRYAANPEREKAQQAVYRSKNREPLKRAWARWRAENPERQRQTNSRWVAENPDKVKANRHRRRARKRDAPGSWTDADIARLLVEQHQCFYCEHIFDGDHTVDHIVPLDLGGTNYPENLQLVCKRCNSSKGARHPLDFAASRGVEVLIRWLG